MTQRSAIEIESEVTTNSTHLRLRVRWFQLLESDPPYLLVTLEDCEESFRNQAIAEGQKCGLTPREAEVWTLRRARISYKEIAAKLYITENTVKKHVKNINAKCQVVAASQAAKWRLGYIESKDCGCRKIGDERYNSLCSSTGMKTRANSIY